MTAESELADAGADLAGWLAGKQFGDVQVLHATSDVIVDVDGYTALDVTVTAENPLGDTWSTDDILALRRALDSALRERVESVGVYLSMRPRTDDPQDDEDPASA